MPLLFSYGSLQQLEVQLATFRRPLTGVRDALPGHDRAHVRIDDESIARSLGKTHYDNAVPCEDRERRVDGMAFEVTDEELAAADGYEEPARYRRTAVILASGREAWVYVHDPGERP